MWGLWASGWVASGWRLRAVLPALGLPTQSAVIGASLLKRLIGVGLGYSVVDMPAALHPVTYISSMCVPCGKASRN
jgi:hypothetical protein